MRGKISFLGIALLTAFVVGACGNASGKKAESLPTIETLVADSIVINEVLQPQNIGLYGDYAVLISPKTSKVVFRYKLPDWTFADSTFAIGGGPDDLQFAFLEGTNGSDGSFWLGEPIRKALMKYQAKNGGLEKVRTVHNASGAMISFGEILNDSVMVSPVGNFQTSQMRIYSFVLTDKMTLADSLPFYGKMEAQVKQLGKNSAQVSSVTYNYPVVKSCGDRLVVWYGDTQNLLVYKAEMDGKMMLEKTYGDTLALKQARDVDMESIDPRTPKPSLIAATDGYLYFRTIMYDRPLAEVPPGEALTVADSEIKVYDWEMNLVRTFHLDRPRATQVLVDEKNGRMYAYDRDLDFDQVYVYSYSL